MSKRNIVLIVLVCLAVAGVVGVFFFRPSLEKIDINRGGPTQPEASVPQALTKVYPPENSNKYSIQVEYPELQGIPTLGIQEKVNGRIKAGVYNQIAAFKAANASNSNLGDEDMKSSFDGSFDVVLLTRSFFSGLMSYSDYSAGAAHPNGYVVALNYDLKKGEAVTLDQFLKSLNPSSGYMARLGAQVRKDLIRQFGDTPDSIEAIDFGASPNAENYANFTLDTGGLSIHFDPYQVAPYAAGSPSVKIPYSDLISVVAKPDASASASSSERWWLD